MLRSQTLPQCSIPGSISGNAWHRPTRSAVRRARNDAAVKTRAVSTETETTVPSDGKNLNPFRAGIAHFYDSSTGLWESMWGDHCHHGFYKEGAPPASNQQAQEDMIEETLKFAGVTSCTKMVDVGCGLGGSSRYIARKFPGCTAQGITLSPYQAQRGNEISASQGLGDTVSLQVADALAQPFTDNEFDLVWSMESGEHMPDKKRFVGELVRVCAPGGRVIVVTWCHRVLDQGEAGLKPEEEAHLQRICDAYYLPAWCSVADYEKLFIESGLEDVKSVDWSVNVAPFWGEVIKSALTVKGLMGLFQAGMTTIRGALVMPLMAQGFNMGLIKFVCITGQKKTQ